MPQKSHLKHCSIEFARPQPAESLQDMLKLMMRLNLITTIHYTQIAYTSEVYVDVENRYVLYLTFYMSEGDGSGI